MPKGEKSGGVKHRNQTTFAAADPANPRGKMLSFRPVAKLAAEIDARRGKITRTDYINLLLAYALNQTQEKPPYVLLPFLNEFMAERTAEREKGE